MTSSSFSFSSYDSSSHWLLSTSNTTSGNTTSSEEVYDKNDWQYYYPYHANLGIAIFFTIIFFLYGFAFTYQAFHSKKYFILVMAFFAYAEGGGYIARSLFAGDVAPLHDQYLAQIIILILSPTFAQAYMYNVASDLIIWSKMDANSFFQRYATKLPHIFIAIDLICLVIQGIAGGIMSSPSATKDEIDRGRSIIFAGLALQMASLSVFIIIVFFFSFLVAKPVQAIMRPYIISLDIGMAFMLARNIYRMVEFGEGTSTDGSLNEKEVYSYLGDAFCMFFCCLSLMVVSVAYIPENTYYEATKTNEEEGSGSGREMKKIVVKNARSGKTANDTSEEDLEAAGAVVTTTITPRR